MSSSILDINCIKHLKYLIVPMSSVHTGSLPAPQNDFMDTDDLIDVDAPVPAHSLLSAAQNLNPFSLINSTFRPRFFDGGTAEFSNRMPQVSHPREVREIPIEFKDGNSGLGSSVHGPTIEEVTGSVQAHGSEVHGNVIIDDDDDDDNDDNIPSAPSHLEPGKSGGVPLGRHPGPDFSPSASMVDYGNDIEEEMIKAAIEASKREAEASASQLLDVPNVGF